MNTVGSQSTGPLAGLRVVELAAPGAASFACMLLADMGAELIRVERPGAEDRLGGEQIEPRFNVMRRGRPTIALNLKDPAGREALLSLTDRADVIIEANRPGVAERLGIGPDECLSRNPRLIYARITGWGQTGPLARIAGHDLNFIALSGALDALGPSGCLPTPPLNLLGDFAGGGLYLVFGILSALYERNTSGAGQVIDAAMIDGAASMMSFAYGLLAAGRWSESRGTNLFDGGAPWYATYATSDEGCISIGTFEPVFYRDLLEELGIPPDEFPDQFDRTAWPAMRERFASIFMTDIRSQWESRLQHLDVCFSPVLPMRGALEHPHNVARSMFATIDGVQQPSPAPRLSRTPGRVVHAPAPLGHGAAAVLGRWGLDRESLRRLSQLGAFGATPGPDASERVAP